MILYMELNNVLIDLEIIKQIKENDKLGVIVTPGNKRLLVDSCTKLLSITRWYNGFNRENSIQYLDELVSKIENISSLYIEGNHTNMNRLLCDKIKYSKPGLEVLKNTYIDDSVTVAKLTILINKLDSVIDKLNDKSNIFSNDTEDIINENLKID